LNWSVIRSLSHVQIGAFLALMIVVMLPIFSPRLPSVLLSLLSGWLIWTQRTNLFASVAVRRLIGIFALLWIPMLLSIPTSFNPRYSAMVALAMAFYTLAGLAVIQALRGDVQRLWLAKWISVVMIVWMADGMIQYFFGYDLLGYPLTVDGRLTGVFHGSLALSGTLAILLPIAVWYFMRQRPLMVPAMFGGAGIVAVFVGTRNALVMLMIVAMGTLLRMPRRYQLAMAVAVLVVAGAISLSPAMQQRLLRFEEAKTTTYEYYNRLLSWRLTIWETASRMVIDRPVTGVGVGMFAVAYDHYSTRPDDPFRTGGTFGGGFHAHNVYMSIAAETGLFGFFGAIVAFVLCVKWYYAAPPSRREEAWPFGFSLLIAVFPLSGEYGIYKHSVYPVVLLLLCATLAALEGKVSVAKTLAEER
jgi:O-antigen ligase